MTARFIFKIFLSIFAFATAQAENTHQISTPANFLGFDLHESFLGRVPLTKDMDMLLTKGRHNEGMVYIHNRDGRVHKINITALQYARMEPRNEELYTAPGGLSTRLAEQRIIKGDFNKNGKIDVAYVSSYYEELVGLELETAETAKNVDWSGTECGNFDVILVLDDMQFTIAIHFDDGTMLDIGGMRAVLVNEHTPALRSSSPVSNDLWELLRDKVLTKKTEFSCVKNYDDMFYAHKLEVVDTLHWKSDLPTETPPSLNWEAIQAQFRKSVEYFQKNNKWPRAAFSTLASINKSDQWHILYDFDPENKNNEYTDFLGYFAVYINSFKDDIRHEFSVPLLVHSLHRDPERTQSYLDLADAQYEAKRIDWPDRLHQAATLNYREYHKRMVAAGKKDQIPARVFERMK